MTPADALFVVGGALWITINDLVLPRDEVYGAVFHGVLSVCPHPRVLFMQQDRRLCRSYI